MQYRFNFFTATALAGLWFSAPALAADIDNRSGTVLAQATAAPHMPMKGAAPGAAMQSASKDQDARHMGAHMEQMGMHMQQMGKKMGKKGMQMRKSGSAMGMDMGKMGMSMESMEKDMEMTDKAMESGHM